MANKIVIIIKNCEQRADSQDGLYNPAHMSLLVDQKKVESSTMTIPYPSPANEITTKVMRSNKSENTQPEIVLRTALRNAGYPGYRLHWKKAPGHPDIAYPGKKVAIFVNGCFWHRCPYCNLPLPKRNQDYWIPKFQRNVERDQKEYEALKADGWKVEVVWECEMKSDLNSVVDRIVKALV